jgi:hypothetical protein
MNNDLTVAPIGADGSNYDQDFDMPPTPATSPWPTRALIGTLASRGGSQ